MDNQQTAPAIPRKIKPSYIDEARLTHYLGNDEYSGNEEPRVEEFENADFDGYEAAGNELTDEDIEEVPLDEERKRRKEELYRQFSLHGD